MKTGPTMRTALARFYLAIVATVGVLIGSGCASRVSYRELAQEYYNLGNAFFELGEYEASFQYYTRAIELDDQLPASSYNLARLLSQRGEHEQALTVIEELLEDDPDNSLFRETYAYIAYMAGEDRAARREYRALIAAFPARPRLRYNLARLEIDEDRPEIASEILLAGQEWAEDDGEYQWLAAEAAFRSDNVEDARKFLERFRSINREEPSELARLARRYAEWDFLLDAAEILETIPDLIAEDPSLRFLQSRLYLVGTGDFDGGIEALREALRSGFDDSEELMHLLNEAFPEDRDTIESIYEEFGIDPATVGQSEEPDPDAGQGDDESGSDEGDR